MLCGLPASGKSSLCKSYEIQGYVRLNRDTEGGSYKDLALKLDQLLIEDQKIIIDNCNFDPISRKIFLDVCAKYNKQVDAIWLDTSSDQCHVNAAWRLLELFPSTNMDNKDLNFTFGPNLLKKNKNPNVFQPAIIEKFKKLENFE